MDRVNLGGASVAASGPGDQLGGGCRPSKAVGDTSASVEAKPRLYGPDCAPSDLIHFLRESPIGAATRALGMAHGTVHRLRHGYWPSDPRKIMQAWNRYKGRRSIVASSWFIRRVRPGGAIRHAGHDYTAPRLAARTGQMLAVARGLMSRPKILLLDEPSMGLAPIIVNQIYDLIRQIRDSGITVLLVEQNARKALGICDYAYVLENGKINLSGAGDELLRSDAVRKAYLGG